MADKEYLALIRQCRRWMLDILDLRASPSYVAGQALVILEQLERVHLNEMKRED